jgi:Na+-driven multidrug efflux pump
MSILFGLLGSVVGIIFARPMMILMGYTDRLLELGLRYAYIYLAFCIPFISLTNFLGAILRANGNTRTSLYVLSFTGFLNVPMNLFFILVMDLSVEGVAIATAIANVISAAILWRYLMVQNTDSKLSFKKLHISKRQFGEIARVGFPAGIQNALFSLSNMIIQSSIVQVDQALTPPGSAYAPVIKGNTATANLETFIFTALSAVSSTASAFTGQNVGKQDYKRVRAVLWQLCLISSAIAVLMSAAAIIFHKPLFALYGVTEGSDILAKITYETALKKAIWKWPAFLIYAIMNTCAGVLRGLGKSTTSAMISFVGTCVFRVVWIYTVFRALGSLESIYISYPISWLLTGIFFMITVLYFLHRIFAQSKSKDESIKA